jgi:hypothetical protein
MRKKLTNNSIHRILTTVAGGVTDNTDQNSLHVFTESSIHGDEDNDSDILEPLGI